MSDSESESDFDFGDSEYSNILETVRSNVSSFHQEVEPDGDGVNSEEVPQQDFDEFVPYVDEPLADPEWTEEVLEDVGGTPPSCITLHPGFRPNCWEKWALKLQHAAKYRTRDRIRYKQTDSQER